MSRLLGTRIMIKRMVCAPRETELHTKFWSQWWVLDVQDAHDAMGVCLMGGEL